MSTITSNPAIISASLPSAAPGAAPKTQPTAVSSSEEAVIVSLSAPAQASVASQSTSSSTPASNASSTTAKQTPVASQTPTVDVAQLVSAATRKVTPQVGVSGARDVVDSKGNISKAALTKEIAEQAQQTQQG